MTRDAIARRQKAESSRRMMAHRIAYRAVSLRLGFIDAEIADQEYDKLSEALSDRELLALYREWLRTTRTSDQELLELEMRTRAQHLADDPSEPECMGLSRRGLEQDMYGTQENQAECSICMGKVKFGVEVVQLLCEHWFHPKCITEWLLLNTNCPICRCKT